MCPVADDSRHFAFRWTELDLHRDHPDGTLLMTPYGRGAIISHDANQAMLAMPCSPAPLRGRRLLVAEDRPDLSRMYRALLERAGAEVVVAPDGPSAVAAWGRALRFGRGFEGAILDLELPGMRGTEVAAKLRIMGHCGAIVGVSAFVNGERRSLWLAAGCDAVLAKDRPWDEVLAALSATLLEESAESRSA